MSRLNHQGVEEQLSANGQGLSGREKSASRKIAAGKYIDMAKGLPIPRHLDVFYLTVDVTFTVPKGVQGNRSSLVA